jgi:hypothetical protein
MTMTHMEWSWSCLSSPLRALGRWLTIVQVVGYTTALVFVWVTTRMVPTGITERYSGSALADAEGPMKFAKSLPEMLTLTHTHLFSLAAVFALSGLGLALCRRPSALWRGRLIVEPFVAILVSFACMWLMRYVDGRFSWLLALSSGVMAVTFYVHAWWILHELGWRERLPVAES